MRSDELCKPLLDFLNKRSPFSVHSSECLDSGGSRANSTGIEEELVVSSTNVLWGLDQTDDIFSCDLSACISASKVIPFSLLWEMMELKIVEG